MSLARVSGHPNYASSGTNKFIPEIWSGKMLVKFYDATVFADISNTDYEGEIKKYGDKVHIRTVPNITIRDYQKGMTLTNERPESASVELNIDKGKYFSFTIDKVDKYQSDLNLMSKWAEDAGEQMKIAIDADILNAMYVDAAAENKGATAGRKSASFNLGAAAASIALTSVNILDYIVDCGTVLDEQNIPENSRWMVIPAWMGGMIKKSDLKDASLTGDGQSALRNGRIGMIDRFTLYLSNNLTSVVDGANTCWNIPFGHKAALTFAAQMTEMETLKAESTFGEIVRGLNVYGYEVIKASAMGVLYARKG